MKKVMLVFGTRPEAIKMAPLVKEFQMHPDQFQTLVCVTGQHRESASTDFSLFFACGSCGKRASHSNTKGHLK